MKISKMAIGDSYPQFRTTAANIRGGYAIEGRSKRSLDDYENVLYLLIGRDHWAWYQPADGAAVVDCNQFQLFAMRHSSLKNIVQELLK